MWEDIVNRDYWELSAEDSNWWCVSLHCPPMPTEIDYFFSFCWILSSTTSLKQHTCALHKHSLLVYVEVCQRPSWGSARLRGNTTTHWVFCCLMQCFIIFWKYVGISVRCNALESNYIQNSNALYYSLLKKVMWLWGGVNNGTVIG